ncbi:MAG: sensor histidine kinase, partial [Frankia sp.]|nr:sensor histidine kinase [Frankia sp.]
MENWPLRYKLTLVLVVPLLALAGFSWWAVASQVGGARAAERSQALASFRILVNELVYQMQIERYTTARYIGTGYQENEAETAAVRSPVDAAAAAVAAAVEAGLPVGDNPRLGDTIDTARGQLGRLAELREQVDAHTAQPGPASQVFSEVIGSWLDVGAAQVGVGSTDPGLVRTASALTAISLAKENASVQRGFTAQLALGVGGFSQELYARVRSAAAAEVAWTNQFRLAASPDERELYDERVAPVLAQVTSMQDAALAAVADNRRPDFDPMTFITASEDKFTRLRDVEARVSENLEARSADVAEAATARAWLAGVVAVVVMLLAVGVSLVVSRRLVRQLRGLRDGAQDIAERGLPAITSALRERQPVDPEVAGETVVGLPDSADEIGDVARSMRAVFTAAARSATEVAAQSSVGASLQHLARRSQKLIHRQLRLITELERDQQDPDMLDKLFALDHLGTRMRREVEGQIVLSGGRPTRTFKAPIALVDLLRAAAAEVEAYTRVQVSAGVDTRIATHAVGDIIHLLAELIENATQLSPDATVVEVTGSPVGTGLVVEIVDRGIGIDPQTMAELNERLANPPPFDPRAGDKLGLYVVA